MSSLLPSIFALGAAGLAALVLTVRRWSPPEKATERIAAARTLAVAVLLQSIHFAEEALTGFHREFPGLFGLPSIPFVAFAGFNLAWIAIWVVSVPGLRSARSGAFFAAWFLAIAGTLNGVAHPIFAVSACSYFPGLVSSPFVAVASAWLWLRLRAATIATEGDTSRGLSGSC